MKLSRHVILVPLAAAIAVAIGVAAPQHVNAEANDRVAVFALVIGVNKSVDADLAPLRYADDDAAQYLELFRTLGARTYLLADLDDNTRRVHAQAAAEARAPSRATLAKVVALLHNEIALARERGIRSVFYFVYAGHGSVRDGKGYLSLSDAHLTAQAIGDDIVEKIAADQTHLIVDACNSYFLANSRGPGGNRRSLRGFSNVSSLAADKNVGLLLSTSSASESHEWEGVQAGVFSHEVRSGLYGAADADADGQISYREIAAFVSNANASIPNERFRPEVYARSPQASGQLVDLRSGLKRRIEVDESAHYLFEDQRGVRLAQFHNAPGQVVWLLRPAVSSKLYVTRLDSKLEYSIVGAQDVVDLAKMTPAVPRTDTRGAAHDAFSLLFTLPFDRKVVAQYNSPSETVSPDFFSPVDSGSTAWGWKKRIGWTAIAMGGVATVAGSYFAWSAYRDSGHLAPNASHQEVVRVNEAIREQNRAAQLSYGIAAASAVTGTVLLLWPQDTATNNVPKVEASPGGALLTYGGTF